jgi:hypothetical protein
MSRDDGFPTADIDVGLFSDPKVIALARRLRDPLGTLVHVALYEAVVLASWRAGERVDFNIAAPGWFLDDLAQYVGNLQAVGLLDDDRRIPAHAWTAWIGPAVERRLAAKRRAIYGGLVSSGMTPADANAETDRRLDAIRARFNLKAQPTGSTSVYTVRPSIPSVRPLRDDDGRNGTTTTCVVCHAPASDRDPGVRVTRRGLVHEICRDAFHAGAAS